MAQRSALAQVLLLVAGVATMNWLCAAPREAFVSGVSPQLRGPGRLTAMAMEAATAETMAKTVDIIAEQLGVEKVKVIPGATLTELGADSLDIVEAVMALEESFDVELPDEETTKLKTVQDAADLIQTKLS
ncbi:unnamed protein product [Polarella glacialis]|uniref:Acyl carrier protein n=1 Tax=Polarella glacialis TaxID=89957 RepID=A0A813GR87_POLGL|nr:unnamed protein product [Polarella glacialis]CAE8627806.1 unnamed protein product [Polarella glacialis]CAE8735956.1 unnamed protein product [Polarella glacialis]CAE8735957.1 unnamed protein product [Polarella glacialis]CAE8735960.1 unnamed protein product [Polarella glacialis]